MASSDQRTDQALFARYVVLVLLCLLLALSIPNPSIAQTTTSGGLTGVVIDPSGAVVIDAEVEIKNDSKGTIQSAITDRGGVYRFFFLTPAVYSLSVSHTGFRTENRTVTVLLGPPVSLNVTLQVAKATASVSVLAEAPLLNAENGDVSTTMNAKQIAEIPNPGNDLTYIAQTAPGAIMNTDTIGFGGLGNFSILGMPGTSNLFTLNGMNNNNTVVNTNNSGVMGMLMGQNEVQEATIVSNGYSGQFGGVAGASVNYLTKSGGNAFHGNAQYYWNGTALNANDWFDNAFGNPRPVDTAHQWAGSVGGPIKKDKLFFFFDTEGMSVLLPYSPQAVLPSTQFESATIANIDSIFGSGSASHKFYEQVFDLYNSAPGASRALPGNFNPQDPTGCNGWVNPNDPNGVGATEPCAVHFLQNVSVPSSQSLVSGRVDWNLGSNDRLFLLAQFDHGHIANFVDAISPVFDAYSRQPWWQGQLSETHTIGPTAANQFLLGLNYTLAKTGVTDPSQALTAFPVTLNWWNAGQPFTPLGGLDYQYALPSWSKTISYQISDDLVKTRGKHKLGLGVSFLRTYWSAGGGNWSSTPQLLPQTIDAFFFGGSDPSSPNSDYTSIYQSFPAYSRNDFWFYSLGLYGQDEWHARSNLSITLALRADHQSNPICDARCFARLPGPFSTINHDPNVPYNKTILINHEQAFVNTDSIVWSPRFSFAWQPRGVSHNTVLRGGIGIFYDPVPGGLGPWSSANTPPLSNYFNIRGYSLAPDEKNSLFQNSVASNTAFANGFSSGQTLAQIQSVDPNFSVPIIQIPAATIHSAQYQKWSLQAQQSFGASRSLTISYFGNHGLHELSADPNLNAFGFGSFPNVKCGSPLVAPCYDSRFGLVSANETNAVSNYHGMVVSFEQRITGWGRGLFQANYTLGHALDEVSNGGLGVFTGGSSLNPQDASNLRGSYGPAEYDARHLFSANYVWEIPLKAALGGHGPDSLVKGWQVSGTIFYHTGLPYTVFDNQESSNLSGNNFGGPIYAVPVAPLGPGGPCGKGAAVPAVPVPCLPPQVQGDGSPAAGALFVQTGCETGFNSGHLGASGTCDGSLVTFAQGRNHFRTTGFFNTDFSVMKNTKIPHPENVVLSMGLQFFNFFNHANFGGPDNSMADGGYGQIGYLEQSPTSILGSTLQANVSPRMIQLKFQLQF
jgi:Carboxypeptidase regulatory-like domain